MKLTYALVIILLILQGGCFNSQTRDVPVNQPLGYRAEPQVVTKLKVPNQDTKMEVDYPVAWPNLVISCLSKNIPWVRGDANFTGQVNGVIGNTSFGCDENKAILIKPTELKPNAVLSFTQMTLRD
ncbi:hypothetical protein N752_24825 [Desulforamulus aquiferis]|nr:hypothetical protein [Desulforamulus aquiferis]RYD02556.1 hypothetical protein N752_24825 [Desulforamulus aquiferis]